MQLFHVFDARVFWHVHGLGNSARNEGLNSAHHLDVTHVVNGVVTHGARKHREVLGTKLRRTHDGLVLIDVSHDGVNFCRAVTQL